MNTGEKKCLIAGIWMGQTPSSLDTPQQPYTYRYAESTTVENYIKECNVFYSNPEHRKIKIIDAYVLATIKLRDDDSDDYGYVLKMLLDNKRLPNRGKVVGVVDGDTIEIEENGTKWEIRLFGIDAPEIDINTQTDKEKYGMKAKQFLSALCLGKRVKLIYRGDYFDKYGRLLANSKLDSDDNYLSQELLKYGLAKSCPYHDPKKQYENTEIEKIYELWQVYSRSAQGNKLYIWGDRTYPYVEKMIREFNKRRLR